MMTTKARLALMDEIIQKNNASWRKYATQTRPGWTWDSIPRSSYRPFATLGEKLVLALCVPALLALIVFMA